MGFGNGAAIVTGALLSMALGVRGEHEGAVEEAVAAASKTYKDYTAIELGEMTIFERLRLYPWNIEFVSVGFIIAYVVLYYLGSRYNENLVKKVIDSNTELLKQQFYQVGVTPSQVYVKDDSENFAFYASGRLNIESLLGKFRLQARQNVFIWSMESLLSFFTDFVPAPQDLLTLEFTVNKEASAAYDDFIWAIVSKDKMNQLRKENYFLSLTKTAESSKLPIEYVYMNEVPEMNELLHTSKFNGLLEASKNFLRFVAVTDQSDEKPESVGDLQSSKKFIVQMKVPKSAHDLQAAHDLLEYLLTDFIDFVITKASFRAELTRRCKKTRDEQYAKLKKVEEDAKKEELAAKKLEQQKRLKSAMGAEEQRKIEKKQQERKQRRMMRQQKVRS